MAYIFSKLKRFTLPALFLGTLAVGASSAFVWQHWIAPPKQQENLDPLTVKLIDREGQVQTLSKLLKAEKPLLIHFWASWCSSCVKELPALASFIPTFQAYGGEVINISLDNHRGQAIAALARYNLLNRLPALLHDPQGLAAKAFAVESLPLTVMLSPDGRILWAHAGAMDWSGGQVWKMINQGLKDRKTLPSSKTQHVQTHKPDKVA